MDHQNYMPLKENLIEKLIANGCSAENWSEVLVTDNFDPSKVKNVVFHGNVKIGKLGDTSDHNCSGIYNAVLNNVTLGDHCYIKNVNIQLKNLIIESNVTIENVGEIVSKGNSRFGNGHKIEVLNEGGGRELAITNLTNAQSAYFTIFYRHDEQLVQKFNELANEYAKKIQSDYAVIGKHSIIKNCPRIIDVQIGEYSVIDNALSLVNGSVNSSSEAPTKVENGVIAENFIFQQGASVKDGAMVSSSLIGEGTRVGKQCSIENSAVFANSECFHSELCSVFAGPYSVTHHRSTLLIAGFFSFYNAGSGTNQSNHMYKLGPVHQGILERGCKTGSFSYLLWPSYVGAFSAIIGKHYANFDTSDFPFSYIDENDGKSMIIPGMNLFTTGTMRDGMKWPTRDRRKNSRKLDFISFDILSPFTIQKAIKAQEILTELHENSQKGQQYVSYQGIQLKRLLLKTCKRYYKLAIDKYFGDVLLKRISKKSASRIKEILQYDKNGAKGDQQWIDLCGMLCPKSRIDELMSDINSSKINSFKELYDAYQTVNDSYESDEWNWFLAQYQKMNQIELSDASDEDLLQLLAQWKESSMKILNMTLQDAQKEFEGSVRIGYGINGNSDSDFDHVRGKFEDNSFIKTMKNMIVKIDEDYEKMKKLI